MDATVDCWKILDLPARSDERSVKRQYAKLLKVTRPDENPVAFQQLREAYERALQLAREGDDGVGGDASLVQASAAPLVQRPAPVTRPVVRSAQEQAAELLETFDDTAVDQCWNEAIARGIESTVETLLFMRCAHTPDAYPNLLRWGLETRQWLTPWQQVRPREADQQRLGHLLSLGLYRRLEQCMADGEETRFIECLKHHSKQGWLGDLARRQTLHVQVLDLFLEHKNWSPALFQRIRQLFAWDTESAVVPIVDEQWHTLLRRCEEKKWVDELRARVREGEQHPNPRANAAALFLTGSSAERLQARVATFTEADWQACEELSEAFTTRFPDWARMFPDHNPWFWKALVGHESPQHVMKRACAGMTVTLALGMNGLHPAELPVMVIMPPILVLLGVLAAYMGKWLLDLWVAFTKSFYDIDQSVSAWCARHQLTRDRRFLVIRNSVPMLTVGFILWKWLGLLGVVTYVITLLIGKLPAGRAVPINRQYRWRRPLQAIYRIAGLSPLQWLFGIAMVVVIAYVQQNMPGTLLTQGS
ncbi:J domain-containing protein [Pseudomonas petrae]|uniref:J domain-containing protein n=1 Tax=Pseudomonas petrae TaxID=2912190 RepID=UPI001F27902E|nr:J domain-containing protein [Pseudomonas petrae]MCF7533047.1 J domain-containing protein [Pseudomonas petrae]